MTTLPVEHDTARHRFVAVVDGHECVLDYVLQGQTMVITHTGVPQEVGGRGIAAALTETALSTARQQGWKVSPICAYAAAYMRRHSDTHDLLA